MTAADRLLDNGYEDVVIFTDFGYDDALIGVSDDNRAIYDYNKMVQWLIEHEDFSEIDAIEWIYYNTIGALSFVGASIILYPLFEE